ncbi:MAG TPA: hypothetical protein VFC07_11295 [Verrucomicrobiae bacterium]|nr:hypothetical protein [Verrucomicrobiae bacterium]
MVEPRKSFFHPARKAGTHRLLFLVLALLGLLAVPARAALQFDVFLGYDGIVPEASWFPLVCEVKNDGPPFTGIIEVASGRFNESQVRRVIVELPTGTLKRIVIPVFSTARYQSSWDIRLLDERGKLREDRPNYQPKRQVAAASTLVGALPRTATGVPTLRQITAGGSEFQPLSARIPTAMLPDNPLVLEGMDTIYLNSEKAVELNENQVNALLTWLNIGGHLVVGVEQISDINATPWLRSIVPCDLTDLRTVSSHAELQEWLRNSSAAAGDSAPGRSRLRSRVRNPGVNPFPDLPSDPDFEKAELQVATGTVRGGDVMVSVGGTPLQGTPLLVTSHQGRGRVTVLLFSPEREPFRSWKNLPSFWAKVAEVAPELYTTENNNISRGGWSIDGVFGAMIDSKQIRKLPVEWLLLLLIVYLLVIGPLDQYWLKRLKRPMLTWITFPCYVVLFSLLIYFIGYKLRAGETEWNEIHLVDVLANREGAELRGRTYASIYSPVNATYKVESQQRFSTFRGEFQSSWSGGGQENERAEVYQNGDNFKADIFVPVWTSQLYVSDWWQSAPLPLDLSVAANDSGWSVTVKNQLDRPVTGAHLVVAGRIMELGDLPAGQTKAFKFAKEQGTPLKEFVQRYGSNFQNASTLRQRAFGNSVRIDDLPNSSMAVSFVSNMPQNQGGNGFISPPGLDLSSLIEQGNAVLLAWESDYSPIKPINLFPTRRSHKDTLWRMSVPVNTPSAP